MIFFQEFSSKLFAKVISVQNHPVSDLGIYKDKQIYIFPPLLLQMKYILEEILH